MNSSEPNKPGPRDFAPILNARSIFIWVLIIAGIVGLAVLKNRMKQSSSTSSSVSTLLSDSNAPASAVTDFQKLKGKWLRPDGGYVIEIKSADDSGTLDAGYFNPKPIHVAKAEAKQEGSAMKVFIELQDLNYPGSTYTLTYIPERDLLAGTYFQALQRQSFEVYFERTQ